MTALRPRLHRGCGLLGLLLVTGLAACKDAPTAPHTLRQLADGEEWVAVTAPEHLPQLKTWLPYLKPATPEQRAVLRRVREMEQDALQARRAGQLRRAREISREATRLTVVSLTAPPEPHVLMDGLGALDDWSARVRAEGGLERRPALAAAYDSVQAERKRAEQALEAGDTTSGVLLLASAAETVREHSPDAVALRVLSRVEERLKAEKGEGRDLSRALHLLGTARQELLSGDPSRALLRALYALQLADGNGMPTPDADQTQAVCYETPCSSP